MVDKLAVFLDMERKRVSRALSHSSSQAVGLREQRPWLVTSRNRRWPVRSECNEPQQGGEIGSHLRFEKLFLVGRRRVEVESRILNGVGWPLEVWT